MSEKTAISTLKKRKKEAQASLHSLEIEIGHYLLKKPETSMHEEVIKTYESFDLDVENFRATQETINALTEERHDLQRQMAELKDIITTVKGEFPDVYKTLGQSLFSGYTAAYSDCFGTTYTQATVHEQKVADERKKEESIRENIEKAGFLSRMVKQVQAGAAKTQVITYEHKVDTLLTKSAKAAIESGKIAILSENNQLDENSETIFNEYLELQTNLNTHQTNFDALSLNEGSVITSLAKNGASGSAQKCIQGIEKEINQKKLDQDEFSATQGHEYACRYVSPDGESIVDFPSDIAKNLLDIQNQKLAMISFERQIEILELSHAAEETANRIKSYNRTITANKEKAATLKQQNEELASKIKTAQSEQKVLNAKKEVLETEEKAATKPAESDM